MRKKSFNKSKDKILLDEQISIEDISTDDSLDLVAKMNISKSYRLDNNDGNGEMARDEILNNADLSEELDGEKDNVLEDDAMQTSVVNSESNDSFDWLKKHQRIVATCGALLFLTAVVLLFVDQLLRPDSNQVRNVQIMAQYNKVDAQKVKDTLHGYVGMNYFSVELNEVQNTLLEIPWVRKVDARREWPAKLFVKIEEYDAQARWNLTHLIDSSKNIFVTPENNVPAGLVSLNGPQGQHEIVYDDFNRWDKLFKRRGYIIEKMTLSNRFTYEMKLRLSDTLFNDLNVNNSTNDSDVNKTEQENSLVTNVEQTEPVVKHILLKVGSREDSEMRIERFIGVVNQVIANNLLKVESVDLRYEQGFSVKWVNDEQPAQLIANNE